MKLTRRKAIELCIELWTWCMETGGKKENWPEWKKYKDLIVEIEDAMWCWFCLYNNRKQRQKQHESDCRSCPYWKEYGFCAKDGNPFGGWDDAKTPRTRKKYAKLFLGQIQSLRSKK